MKEWRDMPKTDPYDHSDYSHHKPTGPKDPRKQDKTFGFWYYTFKHTNFKSNLNIHFLIFLFFLLFFYVYNIKIL